MAVITEHSKVINEITYTTSTFPATQALNVAQHMLGVVPDNVAELLLGAEAPDLNKVLDDPGLMFEIARKLAASAPPNDLSVLAKELLARTTAKPLRIGDAEADGSVVEHFDTHFTGRLSHMLNVCIWVARVGFGEP